MKYITWDYETYRKPILDKDNQPTGRDEFVPLVLGYCVAEDGGFAPQTSSDGNSPNFNIVEKDCFTGENCSNEFCEMLDEYFDRDKKHTEIYCISYNGIGFDNCFLLKTLYKYFQKYVMFDNILSNSTTVKKIQFGNIAIVDFSRLYGGGLDRVCQSFKIPGKQAPVLVDIKKEGVVLEKYQNNLAYKQELESYCIQDCVCLMECYFKHKKTLLEQGFDESITHKFTAAGLAISVLPYFLEPKRELSTCSKTEDMEREAYRGGFTAVFKYSNRSGSSLFYYDINSMYPWAMKEGKMPYELIAINDSILTEENALEDQNLYLVDRIEYPEFNCYGKKTIPNIFSKGEPKLICAEKQWRSGVELSLAKKLGAKYHIIKEVVYRTFQRLFYWYVKYFYNQKSEAKKAGKPALEQFSKLCLNSLYGKMGQRDFEKCCIVKSRSLAHGIQNMGGMISDFKMIFSDEDENYYFMKSNQIDYSKYDSNKGRLVRYARQTTATARTLLFDIMNRIGLDEMYYCDTDSVITSLPLHQMKEFDDLMSNTELGKLKDELNGDFITHFLAFAPKCYMYETFGGKSSRKAKGVGDYAVGEIDYQHLIQEGAEQEVKNKVFKRGLDNFQYYENSKKLQRDPNRKFNIVDEEKTLLLEDCEATST